MPELPRGPLTVTSDQDRVPDATSLSTEVEDGPFLSGLEVGGQGLFLVTPTWRMQTIYTRRVSRYLLPLAGHRNSGPEQPQSHPA